MIEGTEECEGVDLNGETCESLGYYGGDLACDSSCVFDSSNCASYGLCGDGIVQDGNEECDGVDLNGGTCESLGYSGGSLICTAECAFDLSGCTE